MSFSNKVPDLQGVIGGDLYAPQAQQIDNVKQVLDTLKDRVQPLTPIQVQALEYLNYLQGRKLHGGAKPYDHLMKTIENYAQKVAPPGFFIRVIEALIPRPIHVDSKTHEKMKKENDGRR